MTILVIVMATRLQGKKNVTEIWVFERKLTKKQLARAGARRHPCKGQHVALWLDLIRRALASVDTVRVEKELDP